MNTKTLAAFLLLAQTSVMPVSALAMQHRHTGLKSVAAGVAAYEVAKHTGRPGHKNFAQRHPIMTGVAAGMITHHFLKKHRH
jgi:hypothetical protein